MTTEEQMPKELLEMCKEMDTQRRREYVKKFLTLFLPHMSWEWVNVLYEKTPSLEEDYSGKKFAEYLSGLAALVEFEQNEDQFQSCYHLDLSIKFLSKYGVDSDPLDALKQIYCTPEELEVEEEKTE